MGGTCLCVGWGPSGVVARERARLADAARIRGAAGSRRLPGVPGGTPIEVVVEGAGRAEPRDHGGQQIVSTGTAVTVPSGSPPPAAQLGDPAGVVVADTDCTEASCVHAPIAERLATEVWHAGSL